MSHLILSSKSGTLTLELTRKIMTAGVGPGFDVSLAKDGGPQLVFTIVKQDSGIEILPAGIQSELKLNGRMLSSRHSLKALDKIEFPGVSAIYFETLPEVKSANQPPSALVCLKMIHQLSETVQESKGIEKAFEQLLKELLSLSNAETAYLLTENSATSEWNVVSQASSDSGRFERGELLSQTALQLAVRDRKPVYVENIVGHPLSSAESIMLSRIFSLACFPLIVHSKVFGALFLFTRTPGKSIRRECLEEFQIIATQAALMLASVQEKAFTNATLKAVHSIASSKTKERVYWGKTAAIETLRSRLAKLAPTDLNILLLGETGVGKEVIAREVHQSSPRAGKPFVAINCAAIPAPLIESILFGVEKGAYTGAHQSRIGKFEEAHTGTLFLDEIGDLPLELQAKLLRVIQEKVVEPVGGKKTRNIDVRIVAATHANLEQKVQANQFRSDLFFRLKGAVMEIPSLKQRREDIIPLSEFFIAKAQPGVQLSRQTQEVLGSYAWPGNIRELEQCIQRACVLCDNNVIEPKDLELSNQTTPKYSLDIATESLKDAQMKFTLDFVNSVLAKNKGSRAVTAAELGISERSLYRILAQAAETDSFVSDS